jgi:filamentous hemagglutinin
MTVVGGSLGNALRARYVASRGGEAALSWAQRAGAGLVEGAPDGFIGGFAGGFTDTALADGTFRDGLVAGFGRSLEGGLEGAAIAGVVGGVVGAGVRAGHSAASALERTPAGTRVGTMGLTEPPTILSVANARRLGPPHEGLIFVRENLGAPRGGAATAARDFEAGTTGAFSEVATRSRVVPALRFENPNQSGFNFIKFDGLEEGGVLLDSKTRILVFESKGAQVIPQAGDLRRMSEALRQNPGFRAVLEFPDAAARREAQRTLRRLQITNIGTRVRRS